MLTAIDYAKLCRDSYYDADFEERFEVLADVGAMGPRGYVLRDTTDGSRVVVFRGTADMAGWLQDASAKKVAPDWGDNLTVHHGFLECWKALRRRVIEKLDNLPFSVTGHSLGGAIATLMAAQLSDQVDKVVTFGSPRVGTGDFVKAYNLSSLGNTRILWQGTDKMLGAFTGPKTFRFVNESDPVPGVPGGALGFRHVSKAIWFNGSEWAKGIGWWSWTKLLAKQYLCEREHIWADHNIEFYIKNLGG